MTQTELAASTTPTPALRRRGGLPLWLATLAALVVLGGWLGWNAWVDYQSMIEREYLVLETGATNRAAHVQGMVRSVQIMLTNLDHDLLLRGELDAAQLNRILETHMRRLPELRSLTVADANGRLISSTNPKVIGFDASGRDYFENLGAAHAKDPKAQPIHISAPIKSAAGTLFVSMSTIRHDAKGGFNGVIVAGIDPGKFGEILQVMTSAQNEDSLVIHQNGTVVFGIPHTAQVTGQNVSGGTAYQQHMNTGQATTRHRVLSAVTKRDAVLIYHNIAGTPLMIVTLRPYADIISPWQKSQIVRTLGFLATLLLLVYLTHLANRRQGQLRDYQDDQDHRLAERTRTLVHERDAAERANRTKNTFLANLSHELRTPMNAISGMSALALRHSTEPRQVEQIRHIQKASLHLTDIANDILDISRIETGELRLDSVGFSLNDVLHDIEPLLAPRLADKKLSLALDIPAALQSQHWQGDPLRLGHVLINLIGHLVKLSSQGEIILRLKSPNDAATSPLLQWEIESQSIDADGMKALASAFDPAADSMTKEYSGAGLSLMLSKHLIELMDGHIDVRPDADHGGRICFGTRLRPATKRTAVSPAPSLAGTESSADPERELQTHFGGTRLLLAEDETICQEIVCGLLETSGLLIDVASNGEVALEKARMQRYALILMDMQMPVMNGIDAAKAIRALPGYDLIPIIALTANAFGENREACLAAGMSQHLPKPIDADLLQKALLYWLTESRKHGLL